MADSAAPATSSTRIYLRLLQNVRPYVGTFAVSILGFVIFFPMPFFVQTEQLHTVTLSSTVSASKRTRPQWQLPW